MSTRRGEEAGSLRGFARMEPNKQRELARKGGANVPSEKRSFSQNRSLASEAGRKGGRQVAPPSRDSIRPTGFGMSTPSWGWPLAT